MTEIISIIIIGLLTIVHPCTLAPNVAALAYISSHGRRPLVGWLYITGHTLAYFLLGLAVTVLLRRGLLTVEIGEGSRWPQMVLAAILLCAGVYIIVTGKGHHHHQHLPQRSLSMLTSSLGTLLGGALVAMLFCPEAAVAFFGILIPATVVSEMPLVVLASFALSTALPLIIVQMLLQRGGDAIAQRFAAGRWQSVILGGVFILSAVIVWLL